MAKTETLDIKPLGNRLVVRRVEAKTVSDGGIFLPDNVKEKPSEGEVVAVGFGKYIEGKVVQLEVKLGDKILFGKYSGTEIAIEEKPYLILREDEVLAVVGKK